MIKINKNLALFSGLFLTSTAILLLSINKFSPLIGHAAYYCQSFITTHMIPIPYYISSVPIALLFLIVSISFGKFFILMCKAQLLRHTLKVDVVVENRVIKLIKRLGLESKTVVIQSNEIVAFCLGVRMPRIYVSTGLCNQLSLKEIEAVLRHEQYHMENHDTFTMILASLSHSLFPFFPLLGDLINQYRVEREIEADQFAVARVGNKPLISALKKLLAFPTVKTVALAAIADHDTLEARIYSLMNKQYIRRQFRLRHLFITVFSSLIVAIILVTPVHAKELHHQEHDVVMLCAEGDECMQSCMSEKNLNTLYSEIPNTKKIINQSFFQPFTPAHQ